MLYHVDVYVNIVDFLLKSRIPVSKIYIFPSAQKPWNTEYETDFDRNSKIPL